MKKITLTLFAVVTVLSMNAQEMVSISDASIGLTSPFSTSNANRAIGACDQGNASGDILGGGGAGDAGGFIMAVDAVVADGDTFSLEGGDFRILTFAGVTPTELTVFYYENGDDGFPGEEIGNESGIALTVNSTESWPPNAAADIHEVSFDLTTPFDFVGEAGSETNYWVGLQLSNDAGNGSTFVEMYQDPEGMSENVLVGEPIVQFNPDTGAWQYVDFTDDNSDPENDAEGFYTLRGDCALSVNDTLLSEVSIFPNPTTNLLNIKVPASVELTGVTLYDVLGKATNVALSNGQINVSSLSRGIYILSVTTSAGTLTEKLIIE